MTVIQQSQKKQESKYSFQFSYYISPIKRDKYHGKVKEKVATEKEKQSCSEEVFYGYSYSHININCTFIYSIYEYIVRYCESALITTKTEYLYEIKP